MQGNVLKLYLRLFGLGRRYVGMCTGVIVHDLSCSILFYPDVLFIMCHTIHLRCCVIHSFSFGCLFTLVSGSF